MNPVQEILNRFEMIAAIPRASKQEQQIARWLQDWAKKRSLPAQIDQAGNLVIRVPGTAGSENASPIVLQGHLDMVCEKTPDSPHDFSKDPICCIVDGDWLRADRTTLGADNGIAIALAMALVDNPQIVHPPLELLFTVEEEIGMGGAIRLQEGFIHGTTLLNLDSEEDDVFIVGCAGGKQATINLPLSFEGIGDEKVFKIMVSGLRGGHSGDDINKHRANANKLLARLLGELRVKIIFRIADLKGGTAHNAIPRDAEALIALGGSDVPALEGAIREFQQTMQHEYAATEPSILISLVQAEADHILSHNDSGKVIDLLQALPTGVAEMSAGIEGFVETSNNLASIRIQNNTLQVISSQRSMVMSRLDEITRRIEAIARLAGAQVDCNEGYPAWQPALSSPLLVRCREIYEMLFDKPPKVETIHAGVECGMIGKRYPKMDMISIGPTILYPHTPDERLSIPSLLRFWNFLVELLKSYTYNSGSVGLNSESMEIK